MNPRLIHTEYSGAAGDHIGRAASFEGALRAAVLRLVSGQYSGARVYDHRFGESKLPALLISKQPHGIQVEWAKPKIFQPYKKR